MAEDYRRVLGEGLAAFSTGLAQQIMQNAENNQLAQLARSGDIGTAVQQGIPIETAYKLAQLQQAAQEQKMQQQLKKQFLEQQRGEFSELSGDSSKIKSNAGKLEVSVKDGKFGLNSVRFEDTAEGKLQNDIRKELIDNGLNPKSYDFSKSEELDRAFGDIQKNKPLSPFLQMQRDKRAEELITSFELNQVKRQEIEAARDALEKIDSGALGQLKKSITGKLRPSDEMLGEWQKIKQVLTDAQLLQTAKTKGAISDKEMELFAESAGNDDLFSSPRIKVVLDKLVRFIDAEEKAKINSYKHIYGEDPSEFLYGEIPDWVPEGKEGNYRAAKDGGLTDSEIQALMRKFADQINQ